MERVDPSDPKHAHCLATITDLSRWRHHCVFTGSALAAILSLRITADDVLEAIRVHLCGGKDVYLLVQNQTGREAYVLLPCKVVNAESVVHELYVKVQVTDVENKKQERLWVISAHLPKFPPPVREKK